jgi:hypothetical protein
MQQNSNIKKYTQKKQFCPGKVVGTSEREEVMAKVSRRVNTMQKMCAHACNAKMIPVETTPGNGDRDNKGEWWRG